MEHTQNRQIELCSIANIRSGNCSENCAFCSQSIDHSTTIETYSEIELAPLLAHAKMLEEKGVTSFSLVASGRSLSDEVLTQVLRIAEKLRSTTKLSLCCSLGFLTLPQATMLRNAGIQRYHHNLETGSDFFKKICTTHSYKKRLETVDIAIAAGLEVCCGGILGLGESLDDRLAMVRDAYERGISSIPINILNPIAGTKLEHSTILTEEEIIETITAIKQTAPDSFIRLAGGRGQYPHEFMLSCFEAGVDGLMTGNYLTTNGFSIEEDILLMEKNNYSPIQNLTYA